MKKSKKYILLTLISIIIVFLVFYNFNNTKEEPLLTLYENNEFNIIIENHKLGKYNEITDYKEIMLIADAYFQTEDFENSKILYSSILEDKSINDLNRAELLYSYSMVLVKLKDIDNAFIALQEGIEESAADLTVSKKIKRSYGLLAKSFPREYNIENALLYLKDVVDLDVTGDDYESNYAYALLLYYAEEYDLSLGYAQNALKINFNYYPAESLIPKIYFESGNTEKAISYLDTLISKYPTDSSFKLYLAQIYELTGDTASALTQYKKALEYDKNNIETHMGLIRIYIAQNKINALIDEIIVFQNTFPDDNKYTDIINKLIDKYFPKIVNEQELTEIIEKY